MFKIVWKDNILGETLELRGFDTREDAQEWINTHNFSPEDNATVVDEF